MKPLILMIILAASVAGQNLLNGSVAIPAGNLWRSTFTFGPGGGTVTGRFSAQGGNSNDIAAYIVWPDDYVNLANGNAFRQFYESGQTSVANINVSLGQGTYVFVFSNKSGWVARTVYGRLTATENRSEITSNSNYNSYGCKLVNGGKRIALRRDCGRRNCNTDAKTISRYVAHGTEVIMYDDAPTPPGGSNWSWQPIALLNGQSYFVASNKIRCG